MSFTGLTYSLPCFLGMPISRIETAPSIGDIMQIPGSYIFSSIV